MSQSSERVRVVVDVMGGDYAPREMVKGAVLAARKGGVDITLVGREDAIAEALRNERESTSLVHCVYAPDVIREGEAPALAVRHKRQSSIVVAMRLLRDGEADAFVSAGSSGAVAAAASIYLGMVPGMERAAIGGGFSSLGLNIVLMDLGANVDCKPYQLLSFAIAGTVYARTMYGIECPTVGLLNVGVEEGKGNALVKEAFGLLKKSGLNFIGCIEGNDILAGKANVIVCDGFVGDVLLKFYESIGDRAKVWLMGKYPAVRSLVKYFSDRVLPNTKLLYEGDEEGGGILWGVNGVVRIAHGASKAEHIVCAINGARKAVLMDTVKSLTREVAPYKSQGIL